MTDFAYLDWPFFQPRHRELAAALDAWASDNISREHSGDVDSICCGLVKTLGAGGWLRHAVAGQDVGGASEGIDNRALVLSSERVARNAGLADFSFAMQGLGSGAIPLHGTPEQRRQYLSKAAQGEPISAFALSEPDAGSDVAAMTCAAHAD